MAARMPAVMLVRTELTSLLRGSRSQTRFLVSDTLIARADISDTAVPGTCRDDLIAYRNLRASDCSGDTLAGGAAVASAGDPDRPAPGLESRDPVGLVRRL